MGVFDSQLAAIRAFVQSRSDRSRVLSRPAARHWPSGQRRDVVLGMDTAIELGGPRVESAATLIWADSANEVFGNRITLVGPALADCVGPAVSFGKVVIVGGRGFGTADSYERYRELSGIRYEIDLKGFMIRAASQYQREWNRISHEAMANGFSFRLLGGALIDAYKAISYVDAAEVLFVTSSREDVRALHPIAQATSRVVSAMNKMLAELACDCSDCEYTDICDEVSELRALREARAE